MKLHEIKPIGKVKHNAMKYNFCKAHSYCYRRAHIAIEDVAMELMYHTIYIYAINQNEQSFTCL